MMAKNNTKQAKPQIKTDYNIPKFSLKSSLTIIGGAFVSTVVFPYLLSLIGIRFNIGVVIGNTFILGLILAYTRFFIETKQGFCKSFWMTYAGFGAAFGFISFFWMFLGSYI